MPELVLALLLTAALIGNAFGWLRVTDVGFSSFQVRETSIFNYV